MELNINSPAYFTQQYGVNEGVYYYCKKCHEYFKDKEYSETLKIIGICPQCAPKDLYQKGMWKDKGLFVTMNGYKVLKKVLKSTYIL